MSSIITPNFEKMAQCKKQYKGEYIVIKYGGSIAANPNYVGAIAKQAAFLHKHIGAKIIIVHGGKEQADAALAVAGFNPDDKDPETGLRITTEEMMPVFDDALRELNMNNVMIMNNAVENAVFQGFSGYENRIVHADVIKECTGEVCFVRGNRIQEYCEDKIPVFYPVCLNDIFKAQEPHLNVNADNMATALAHAVGAKRLFLLSDIDAVLDANGQPLKSVCDRQAAQLIEEGTAKDGMIAKLSNAVKAAQSLPDAKVVILNGQKPDTIVQEILSDKGAGTMITCQVERSASPAHTV